MQWACAILSSVASLVVLYFPEDLINCMNFEKRKLLNIKCVC
jgi:hypothetical protein